MWGKKGANKPPDFILKSHVGKYLQIKGHMFLKQKIIYWKAALTVICSHDFGQGNFFIASDCTDQIRTMKDSECFCHLNLDCVMKGHICVWNIHMDLSMLPALLGQMQVISGKLINFFSKAISENGHNSLTILKDEAGWTFWCSELFC